MQPEKQRYLIGELARAVAGYRTYDEDSLQKLRFIKKARALEAWMKSAELSRCKTAKKHVAA